MKITRKKDRLLLKFLFFYKPILDSSESRWVCKWIKSSHWSYYWAKHFGHLEREEREIEWATLIKDKERMINMVTESMWAYYWALYIGDIEIMKDRITEPKWIEKFNRLYENNQNTQ